MSNDTVNAPKPIGTDGATRLKDAVEHRTADFRCGRSAWVCSCGACRPLRGAAPELAEALRELLDPDELWTECRCIQADRCVHARGRAALKKAGAL